MRFAASVPGGIGGKCAFSSAPSHQRRSAPRLAPTLTAAIDLHMACFLVPPRAGRAQRLQYAGAPSKGTGKKADAMPELPTRTLTLPLLALAPGLAAGCSPG